MSEMIFWNDDVDQSGGSDQTTWYRCVGIGDFLKKVLEKHDILAVVVKSSEGESENNIGFVVREKRRE